MTYFRFHRGSLVDSLDTSISVESVEDVRTIVENHLEELGVTGYGLPMHIDFYGYDARIKKDMYTVRIKYYGLIGWVEMDSLGEGAALNL